MSGLSALLPVDVAKPAADAAIRPAVANDENLDRRPAWPASAYSRTFAFSLLRRRHAARIDVRAAAAEVQPTRAELQAQRRSCPALATSGIAVMPESCDAISTA